MSIALYFGMMQATAQRLSAQSNMFNAHQGMQNQLGAVTGLESPAQLAQLQANEKSLLFSSIKAGIQNEISNTLYEQYSKAYKKDIKSSFSTFA